MANRGAWNQVETDEDGNQVGGVVKNGKKVPKEEGNIPVRGATVVVPVKKIEENVMQKHISGEAKLTPVDPKNAEALKKRFGLTTPANTTPVSTAPVAVASTPAPTQSVAVVATIVTSDLPDLDAISIKPMTDEEKKAADTKIRARKQWAETAGKKLAVINREIAEIEKIPADDLGLDPDRQKTLADLRAARETMVNAGDEGLQKHLAFSTLIAEMRSATPTPDNAKKYVDVGIALGRIRFTEKTIGSSNLILWDETIEPIPDAAGKIGPATIAFTNELRKLCKAAKTADRTKRIASLKATAALTISQLPALGCAYGYLPAREKLEKGVIRCEEESHFTVTCGNERMRPVRAEGRLKDFWSELEQAGIYLTPAELKKGKIFHHIPENQDFRRTLAFLNILRAAAFLEKEVIGAKQVEAAY
ncbi:MAG TPA: hypothetical protein VJI33_01615 [Candidatus Paceibacterota bacterium]